MYVTESRPARRWCVSRVIALIILVLLVGPIITYFVWGMIGRAALQREIARLEAAGEPVLVSSLRPTPPPPEQNGYVHIRRALALLPPQDPKHPLNLARDEPRLPLFDDERTALQTLVNSNRAALDELRPAAEKPTAVADHVQFTSPALFMMTPDLSGLRKLARAAFREAMIDFDAGRHDEALREFLAIEPLARGASSHVSLVGMLVATGMRAFESDAIMQMAPGLKIGERESAASPQLVRATIERLLRDQDIQQDLLLALRAERAMLLDTLSSIADGTLSMQTAFGPSGAPNTPTAGSRVLGWLARPTIWSNARYGLGYMNRVIAQAGAADWPAAEAKLAPLEKELSAGNRWRYLFARVLIPSIMRATQVQFRNMTDRRLAATALALRMYQADHKGRLPAILDELVPAYLPAVPIDPMSGKPVLYRSGDSPAIWSVGADSVDDGGSEQPAKPGAVVDPGARWLMKDAVVPLEMRPRERSVIEPP